MAGIMLKSVRNFRSGDFIKTGEHFGRVTERGLFHTEIQTADRDLTTLPNLVLATNPVTVVRQSGTIVGATVSLGYDVPRTQIEKQLLQAAQTAGLTEPFVQVLELGDYSVLYRVAGLLVETKQLITYRSRLRAAMLDCLHEAKVEIVSPAFINTRAYATDDTFIPAVTSRRTTVPDGAPVDVVFDKAEEAESLSQDRKVCDDLQLELKDARQELKDAPDDASKARAERRIARLDRQIAYLTERIAASEAREREHDE